MAEANPAFVDSKAFHKDAQPEHYKHSKGPCESSTDSATSVVNPQMHTTGPKQLPTDSALPACLVRKIKTW